MHLIAALILQIAQIGAPQANSASAERLFSVTEIIPDDVRMYVHIEDVQKLRKNLEKLPIADWAGEFLAGGQFIQAWGHLAGLAGVNHARLLDMFIGDHITLVIRGSGAELQWLLMTPIDDAQTKRLFKTLRAKVHTTKDGVSKCVIEDHQLFMARTPEGLMLVSHQRATKLLYDVLNRMDPEHEFRTLSREPSLESARKLRRGQAGVYINHAQPLGGWSVATLRFQGRHLQIQHRASFGENFVERPVSDVEFDPSVVKNFAEQALAAWIEPTYDQKSSWEVFIEQTLGGLQLLDPEIRANLGEFRIIMLGDVEGRMQPRQADMRVPTGALCLKVKDGDIAEKQLDEHLIRLSRRLRQMGQGAFVIELPNPRNFIPGEPRGIDLDSFTDWIGADIPLLNNVDLHWQFTESPNGNFLIIASHDDALKEAKRALEKESPKNLPRDKWASVGFANGQRISQSLESLSEQASELAEPKQVKELQVTLKLMASFAFGIKSLNWKLARPCGNEMNLEVDIEFAAPLSAEDE